MRANVFAPLILFIHPWPPEYILWEPIYDSLPSQKIHKGPRPPYILWEPIVYSGHFWAWRSEVEHNNFRSRSQVPYIDITKPRSWYHYYYICISSDILGSGAKPQGRILHTKKGHKIRFPRLPLALLLQMYFLTTPIPGRLPCYISLIRSLKSINSFSNSSTV